MQTVIEFINDNLLWLLLVFLVWVWTESRRHLKIVYQDGSVIEIKGCSKAETIRLFEKARKLLDTVERG